MLSCSCLRTNRAFNSHWKWPEIDGLQNFKGHLIHSADWPKDFEYAGKRVAVLGNGASGVQIVPALQKGKIPINPETLPNARQMSRN